MTTGGMLRGRLGFNAFDVFVVAFVGAFAVIAIYPMWYVLVVSLMPYAEFIRTEFVLLPSLNPDLTYYHGIVIGAPQIFLRAMSVSIVKTAVGAGGGVVITAMLAYAVTKRHVPGTRLINVMVVITIFFSGGLIPLFLLVVRLGLKGSALSLILATGFVNGTYFIIMRNFFSYMVPRDLEDACAIDGANEATAFFRIILPIAKPMVAAILLFLAVYHWNDYTSWLFFVSETKYAPFAILLRRVLERPTVFFDSAAGQRFIEDAGWIPPRQLVMATIVLTMLPILMLYPFLQRHFAKGILIGAVKE
ncbi:MAG: carbohydrate ABC transporter permease [Spirochaetaceae bacterium]|nr:carbohydrate ABC transporter permease [Spirochaetaceae bacterium]